MREGSLAFRLAYQAGTGFVFQDKDGKPLPPAQEQEAEKLARKHLGEQSQDSLKIIGVTALTMGAKEAEIAAYLDRINKLPAPAAPPPATANTALGLTYAPNSDYITLKEGNQEFRFAYSAGTGFGLQDKNGQALSDPAQIQAASTLLQKTMTQHYPALSAGMSAVFLKQINQTDLETVRNAIFRPENITNGKLTNDLAILSIQPFYAAVDTLPEAAKKDFTAQHKDADIKQAKDAFTSAGLSAQDIEALFAKPATVQPVQPAQESKPAEEEETKTFDPQPYLVRNVKHAFKLEPEDVDKKINGFYDDNMAGTVENFLTGIIDDSFADKNERHFFDTGPDGTRNRIGAGDKIYEFVKENDSYTIYEIGADEKRTDAPGHKVTPRTYHPALEALLAKVSFHREDLYREQEILLQKERDNKDRQIKDEQKIRAEGFLKSVGKQDLLEDLKKEIDNGFNVQEFKKSALYRKMQEASAGHETEFSEFLVTMTLLNAQKEQYNNDALLAARDSYFQADSIFKLFQFMGSGQNYDPAGYDKALAGVQLRDNILGLGAYDIIRHMNAGDRIDIRALYDENNPDQKTSVLAWFGGNSKPTREDVYTYVRTKFDLYAIETLTGEKAPENASRTQIEQFIAAHESVLQNVTNAMDGRYQVNGKTVYFNPYERDVELAFKAFERPALSNPAYQDRLNYVRGPKNNIAPDGAYAMRHLDKNAQEALFKAGMSHINAADLKTAVEKVSDRRHYPNTQENKLLRIVTDKMKEPNGIKFAELPQQEKEILLHAIVYKDRPDLYKDENYNRITSNFYEGYSTDLAAFRAGETQRSADNLIQLDANGNTHWQGGWNGRYGGMDKDMLTRNYLRIHGYELDRQLGREASEIFFKPNTNRTERNYDITYEQAMASMPTEELKRKFHEAVTSFDKPTSYAYFIRLRLDYYRDNRAKFARALKATALSDEMNAAAKNNPATDPATNPEEQNGPGAKDPNEPEATAKEEQGLYDDILKKNRPTPSPPGGIAVLDKIVSSMEENLHASQPSKIKTAGPIEQPIHDYVEGGEEFPEKPPMTARQARQEIKRNLDIAADKKTTPAQRQAALYKANQMAEQYKINITEFSGYKALEDIKTKTPLDHVPPQKKMSLKEKFRQFKKHLPIASDTEPPAPKEPPAAAEATQTTTVADDAAKTGTAVTEEAAKTAGKLGIRSGIKTIFSGLVKTLPIVGYAFARREEEYTMNEVLPALISAKLFPEGKDGANPAKDDLQTIINFHVFQRTADWTMLGGELVTTNRFDTLREEHNLDWATTMALKPFLASEIANDFAPPPKELKRLQDSFGAEGHVKLNENIAQKFGIESPDPNIPVGQALMDPELRQKIYDLYTVPAFEKQREGLKLIEHELPTGNIKFIEEVAKKFGIESPDPSISIGEALMNPELRQKIYDKYTVPEFEKQREGLKQVETINQVAALAHKLIDLGLKAEAENKPKTDLSKNIEDVTGQEGRPGTVEDKDATPANDPHKDTPKAI